MCPNPFDSMGEQQGILEVLREESILARLDPDRLEHRPAYIPADEWAELVRMCKVFDDE